MAMDKNFDAAEAEARISKEWEAKGAFRAGANKSRDETFCVMIPPPNVTGALHVGHAFNNTLQDILTRWHRMRGFDTLWQPGQDHAGIATQLQVEKKLMAESNMRRTDLSRPEFLEKVWEWKQLYGGTIINQLKRLGASCDWERNAFTMSGAPGAPEGEEGNFHDAVLKVFVDLYDKGLIYRGKRLVNWDPHFETAISDLEVENIEVDGHMWHVKYPLAGGATYEYVEKDAEGNVTFRETRDYISIATTRPETMLGDGAIAVHPKDERYAPIVGMLCEIPVGPKEHRRLIPIITDEYPDMTFGSGAVKITGAHDFNDYQVASRNGIPMYRLMDAKGRMRDDGNPYAEEAEKAQGYSRAWLLRKGYATPGIAEQPSAAPTENEVDAMNLVPEEYRGLDRYDARRAIVAAIDAEGLMIKVENKKIMQPFGDRSKVVVEPMLTDQWFVDAAKLAVPALQAVTDGRTQILPEKDRKVYFHWLENIEPWCISRQLWWGHQIPVWYGPNIVDGMPSGGAPKMFCGSNFEEASKKAFEYYKTLIPHLGRVEELDENSRSNLSEEDIKEFLQSIGKSYTKPMGLPRSWKFELPKNSDKITIKLGRDPDVLDTWFSSGLWPIGTLGWPENTPELQRYFPTSVLVTGFDILFFWVARMMMMQLEVTGQVPFKTVYLHALVRDEKGVKMSKTLGNVIDPLELIDEFGADAVRFTMASMAALGGTLKLSKERVTGYRNFTTKLWNACRFAEMNGVFEAPRAGIPQPAETVNRWIIGETAKVRLAVDEALGSYRFNEAALALYAFVWGKVCDWYVEFSKPLLLDGNEAQKAETRATMAWVLDQCITLLHPFTPFITEELWGLTAANREKPCVWADWPDYGLELVDAAADREMNWVIGLIEQIRSARAEMNVPAGAKLPMLKLALDAAGEAAWARNEVLILRQARLEGLTAAEAAPKGALTIAVEGGSFAIPLEGIIDIAAEKDRLTKALGKLEKDLSGLTARLGNPKFLASAKEEVVEETRDLAAVKQEEADKLKAALARLAAMA